MPLNINALLKAAGNENATIVGRDGVATDPQDTPYDTGSYSLNALMYGSLYGGLISNKVTALAGESGVGKTYFALEIAKNFLERFPDGYVFYFDTESATTSEMIETRVGNADRFVVVPTTTVEEFRTEASKLLTAYQEQREKNPDARMMCILDSLGNLSSEKEVADIESGHGAVDMTRAKMVKGTFRALTNKFAIAQVPLLFTNHTYLGMGMFPTKTMSGGSGALYAASTVVFLAKAKLKEDTGREKTGTIINMQIHKGRATKEKSFASTRLYFDRGLDKYYGLREIAEEYGIFEKSGNQYVIDGKKYFGKTIDDDPEKFYTPEVMEQLEIAVAKKYRYGSDEEKPEETLD